MAFVQAQEFQLAGSGCSATATSIVITGFTLPDGTKITQSMFGSTGFGTLEPGTSREESISFTGITDNSDGTQTITGVTRGLQFQTPHAEDANLKFKHAGSSKFVLSNTSAFYADQFLNKEDAQTVNGQITFATEPLSSAGAPTDENALVTKAYADSLTVGTISVNRTVIAGTAGATIAAGKVIYLDVADQEWKLADADTAYSTDTQFGIAQGAGTDGGAITNGVLIAGLDATQTGLTAGETYFISTTAGALTTTEPTNSYFVGVAETSTRLIVDFQKDKQPAVTAPDAFVTTSAGAGDAGKGVKLNGGGVLDNSVLNKPATVKYQYDLAGSPHTWTKPSSTSFVGLNVEIWGAGGGGGSNTSSRRSAAGGAGGNYSTLYIPAYLLNPTETVTIGAGGAGGNDSAGSKGGTSSFGNFISMEGGVGGVAADSGTQFTTAVASFVSTLGFTKQIELLGGNSGEVNGTSGGGTADPVPATIYTGAGGGGAGVGDTDDSAATSTGGVSTYAGNGGDGKFASVGDAGAVPGGGGGGSVRRTGGALAGGQGGAGRIIVTEYFN
jgi:hypothetical protein